MISKSTDRVYIQRHDAMPIPDDDITDQSLISQIFNVKVLINFFSSHKPFQGRSPERWRRTSISQPEAIRSRSEESEHECKQLQQTDAAVVIAHRKLHEFA